MMQFLIVIEVMLTIMVTRDDVHGDNGGGGHSQAGLGGGKKEYLWVK